MEVLISDGFSMWQDTALGTRLISAVGHASITVVIRDVTTFQQVLKLNFQPPTLTGPVFKWVDQNEENTDPDGDDDLKSNATINQGSDEYSESDNDAKSIATIIDDSGLGIIALYQPMFGYEKRKANLPYGFLFGRATAHRRADVYLSDNLYHGRELLTILLDRGRWVASVLKGPIKILDSPIASLGWQEPLYVLHPENCNRLVVCGVELEIYCGSARAIDSFMPELKDVMDISTQQSFGSSRSTLYPMHETMTSTADCFHILREPQIKTCTGVLKVHALCVRTNVMYIARVFPAMTVRERRDRLLLLQARLELSKRLPNDPRIIRDERVYVPEKEDVVYLISRQQECVASLNESCHGTLNGLDQARKILWHLLRLVARVHRCGITHGDICSRTVLADFIDDSSIYLAGFSGALADMSRARQDCHSIFRTVREYLELISCPQPRCWIGNTELDRIWDLLLASGSNPVDSGFDDFPTVLELVEALQIDLNRPTELWTTAKILRDIEIKFSRHGRAVNLNVTDIKEYLHVDARRNADRGAMELDVDRLRKNAFRAIDGLESKGTITIAQYHDFVHHMEKYHNMHIGGSLRSKLYQLAQTKRNRPLKFTLSAGMPYNVKYGLINIEFLQGLKSPAIDPHVLEPFLPKCLEVRGEPKLCGIYLPVSKSIEVIEALGLRLETDLDEAQDETLWNFTHPEWYLIAFNESSEIFPVKAETHLVHCSSSPQKLVSELTQQYVAEGIDFDFTTARDPKSLLEQADKSALQHSCGGSVTVETHSGGFRFPRLKRQRLDREHPTNHDPQSNENDEARQRTSKWIADAVEAKRQPGIK